jgi:outer membrane cobalamin receptor
VLIDGVKAGDPTNTRGGSFDFSTLALDDIDRIEVVRGPSSAIYGSDAVGGVINIITRRVSSQREVDMDASVGNHGFEQVAGHLGGPVGRIGGSYTDNGTPVPGSGFRGKNADGALSTNVLDNTSLSLTGRYTASNAQSFPDSSGGPLLAVLRQLDRRDVDEAMVGGHLMHTPVGPWSFSTDYGLYNRTSNEVSPGVAPSTQTPSGIPPSSDAVRFQRNELTSTALYTPEPALDAALGLDLENERGTDSGFLDFGSIALPTYYTLSRTTWAGFGQVSDRATSSLQLLGGARYDRTAGVGGHFSPQGGASYDFTNTGTRLNVSWGRAYRLPSFYALGNPIVGDPTLKPESASNWAAGISQAFAGSEQHLKLDLYDTHYSDLIDFRPGAVPKLVNLSKVMARGGELSVELRFAPALSVTPSVSYTDAYDEATGIALRDVPHWLAGGIAQWTASSTLIVSATFLYVGVLVDNSIPTGDEELTGHERLDLSLSWKAFGNWSVYAVADNVLNAHYQDVVGFPAPGTAVRLGIRLSP